MASALTEFAGISIGGPAVAAGGPVLVGATVRAAQAIPGPALGALLELTGSQINQYAAREVVSVIIDEGYAEALEGIEKLGAIFRSLE
jgi:hypothetical protein